MRAIITGRHPSARLDISITSKPRGFYVTRCYSPGPSSIARFECVMSGVEPSHTAMVGEVRVNVYQLANKARVSKAVSA